jgi:glutaredoxin 3
VDEKIESFLANNPVAIFSFSTCPFCRRAKDFLDEKGIQYSSIELDELDGNEGNEIRAMLGKRTRRTSVPSIFIGGNYIGGCNDGPGLMPLAESGELVKLLEAL